jgi:hypothetical protein
MGLHLNYELSLPATTPEHVVAEKLAELRERAAALPFAAVTNVVRFTEHDLAERRELNGLSFRHLEDVAQLGAVWAREELYYISIGQPDGEMRPVHLHVPPEVKTTAIGFAIAVGLGSEPAAFGLARIDGASRWWWQQFCKTQYASAHGDEHLLQCHGSLVKLLDVASDLGLELDVFDETGFYESRDPKQLFEAVGSMNRLIAGFAGRFTDALRDAGGDSRGVQAPIFEHPDFERLEMGEGP